jgi:hypothetical protein
VHRVGAAPSVRRRSRSFGLTDVAAASAAATRLRQRVRPGQGAARASTAWAGADTPLADGIADGIADGVAAQEDAAEGSEIPADAEEDDDYFGDNLRDGNGAVPVLRGGVLAFEVATHLLYPLSLPVVLAAQGATAARNKLLIPSRGRVGGFLFTLGTSALLWGVVAAAAALDERWADLVLLTVAFTGAYHFLSVGGMYASLPAEQYAWLLAAAGARVREVALLATWFDAIPAAKIDLELEEAQRFAGVDLAEDPDLVFTGGGGAPGAVYLRRLLGRTFGRNPWPRAPAVCRLVACTAAPFVLGVYFAANGTAPPATARQWRVAAFVAAACVAMVGLAGEVLLTLLAGALHHRRKLQLCGALFAAALRTHSTAQRVDDKMLALYHGDGASNLVAWDRVRVVAKQFGRVYENRVSFNTLALMLLTGLLLALILFRQLVLGVPASAEVVLVNYSLCVFVALALAAAASAVMTNRVEVRVVELLAHEEIALRFLTRGGGVGDVGGVGGGAAARQRVPAGFDVQAFCLSLHALRSAVERRLQLDPVRVMYVPARPAMVTAFASVLGVVVSVQLLALTDGGAAL